jgi:hypothetical protein
MFFCTMYIIDQYKIWLGRQCQLKQGTLNMKVAHSWRYSLTSGLQSRRFLKFFFLLLLVLFILYSLNLQTDNSLELDENTVLLSINSKSGDNKSAVSF